jgi:hypothetical protein
MTAPTLNELRNGGAARDFPARDVPTRDVPSFEPRDIFESRAGFETRDMADEKMNQVRDLLVGDFTREMQTRMMAMETRLRDLEVGLGQRLTALNQRIEAIAADHTVDRQSAFEELSKCVLDLGDKIRAIPR